MSESQYGVFVDVQDQPITCPLMLTAVQITYPHLTYCKHAGLEPFPDFVSLNGK